MEQRGAPTAIKVVYKDYWKYSPFADYVLPLFANGRAWPLIRSQRHFVLRYEVVPGVMRHIKSPSGNVPASHFDRRTWIAAGSSDVVRNYGR
jgi:hypothetical protein